MVLRMTSEQNLSQRAVSSEAALPSLPRRRSGVRPASQGRAAYGVGRVGHVVKLLVLWWRIGRSLRAEDVGCASKKGAMRLSRP